MPATPARIGFIREEFRRAVSETPAIKARYGTLARESDDPVETFFDSEADAQVIADARQALLGAERRRFKVAVKDIEEILALPFDGDVPVAHYVDQDRSVELQAVISEIVVDLGKGTATLVLWGKPSAYAGETSSGPRALFDGSFPTFDSTIISWDET